MIIGSPPLVRIKFANLIADHRFTFKGLLGYITTFTFNPDITNGFYFSKSSEGTNNLFFRSYTISFTMTVLHESVIGFVNGEFNSKTDYPYRTENSFFNPIQRPSPSELKSRFGISELRNKGHNIQTGFKTILNRYGEKVKIAEWRL